MLVANIKKEKPLKHQRRLGLRYPLPNYPGLFKDMGKKEVRRKGGWGALAHNDYKSLD